jgi:S-formylglutathione hydrolase FrmB
VAAISPAVDFHEVHGQGWPLDELFDSREQARQETATLNIHPLNWPRSQFFCCDPLDVTWHPGCERLASKLMSMGIPFEADLTTSLGGHNWGYFTKMMTPALEFLVRSLEQVDQDRQVR